MRVTSHCANHPSREAGQRCRSCGKWLCDRCVHPMHGHIFCGLRCRLDDLVKHGKSRLFTILKSPIPTMWFALVLTVAVLALGSWIGSLVVKLAAVTDEAGSLPYAVAEIVRDGGDLRIEIQGSPDATVVLIANGVPVRILGLDDDGRASVTDMTITDSASLEIAALAEPPAAVTPPPALTPTPPPNETSTDLPTVSPSTTPSPTATSTAIATISPTRSPGRTPKPVDLQPTQAPTSTRPTKRRAESKPSVSPPVLHLVTDSGRRIAVTFDGNASSNGTADLLDTLKDLDLEITLFVTGGFIDRYPTLVRRAVLAGHEVGNHTFSHPHLTTYAQNQRHRLLPNVTKEWFLDQLERTEAAFDPPGLGHGTWISPRALEFDRRRISRRPRLGRRRTLEAVSGLEEDDGPVTRIPTSRGRHRSHAPRHRAIRTAVDRTPQVRDRTETARGLAGQDQRTARGIEDVEQVARKGAEKPRAEFPGVNTIG